MKVSELKKGEEYNEYYQTYIDKLPGDASLGSLLSANKIEIQELLSILTPEKLAYRYAEGKWTIAELLQHLIDVERIFQYRALCIARNDQTSFPGFDHDVYVPASEANRRDLESFKREYENVRSSGIDLFESFSEEMLKRIGSVNNSPTSPRAIGYIIVGHTTHHIDILKDRYLE